VDIDERCCKHLYQNAKEWRMKSVQCRGSKEWKGNVLPVLQLQCEKTCLNEDTFAGKRCLNMGSSWISKCTPCTPCTPRITRLWATHYPRDGSLAGKFKLSDGTATAIFPRAISDAHRKVQNKANFNNMIQNATQTQYVKNQSILVPILLAKSYDNSANYFMGQHVSTWVNSTTVLPNSQPLLEFGHSQETPVSWNKHVKLQRHEVENRWERLTFNFVATLNYLEPLQKQAWQSSLVESQDLSWWTSFSCNLSCNLLHVRCLYLSKFGNKDRIGTYWSF
jgi:hypothetical protein